MEFHLVSLADLPELLSFMHEFYPLEGLTLNEATAEKGLRWMLADPTRGALFLMRLNGESVGYCALTAGVSLEFGGPYLLLDELYVREKLRGKGIGRQTLAFVEEFARKANCGALRLEVHDFNQRAKELYHHHGFVDDRRWILTKPL